MNIQPKDSRRGHFYISLTKSVIRIAAAFALITASFTFGSLGLYWAGILLFLAEILGVLEEMA